MKRYGIIFLLLLTGFALKAQNQSDNILAGDEAMKAKNYSLAHMYYDAVVMSIFDLHSIKQLTKIWQENVTLRTDMSSTMRRCYSLLDDAAKIMQDTTSIQLLVTYYTEGIATAKNNEMAESWQQKLDEIRNPTITMTRQNGLPPPKDPKDRMQFFIGYHASTIAPFGFQVGGIGKTVGWYVRFHSNLFFQSADYDCVVFKIKDDNYLRIQELEDKEEGVMYRNINTKQTQLIGSAGIIYKIHPNINVSAGIGYWDRKYYREYIKVEDSGNNIPGTSGWAKDTNSSMNGVAIDLDGMYVFNGRFYGSLGACILNFKYVYPGIGVGFYF